MSTTTFLNYNQSVSYEGKNNFNMEPYFKDALGNPTENFNYALFHQNYPDMEATDDFDINRNQTLSFHQRVKFMYRNDIVELTASGRTRMNKSWNTLKNSQMAATWNNQVDFSMNWTIPGGLNLIADCDYNWYNGYTSPQDDEIILNAEITKLLFKNRFTLALKAYDILGQSKNLSVTDSANYHQDTRNNTLGRYVILSLTYRFGNFKGAKGGQRGPGMMGGPGRGPGGFGGPMGGPPRR